MQSNLENSVKSYIKGLTLFESTFSKLIPLGKLFANWQDIPRTWLGSAELPKLTQLLAGAGMVKNLEQPPGLWLW